MLFLGHASPRRQAFFARHADFFSAFNCHIVVSEVARPRSATTSGYRAGDERLRLVASSRIVLCVHSTERPYFEQHRAMLALANRCLLVTESSHHTDPLEEGVHFASAALDELPALCRRYLADLVRAGPGRDGGPCDGDRTDAHRPELRGDARRAAAAHGDRPPAATMLVPGTRSARDWPRAVRRVAAGDTPWTTVVNAGVLRRRRRLP